MDARPAWMVGSITASALQAKSFPAVRYFLPGLSRRASVCSSASRRLARAGGVTDMALAGAADRYTLGSLKTAQGDELYLALEDSNRRLSDALPSCWRVAGHGLAACCSTPHGSARMRAGSTICVNGRSPWPSRHSSLSTRSKSSGRRHEMVSNRTAPTTKPDGATEHHERLSGTRHHCRASRQENGRDRPV